MKSEKDREIKEILLRDLFSIKKDSLEEISEWLYEEYGIKAEPKEEVLKKKILSSKEITSHDIALLIIENGGYVNEQLWF
ncbi:hypothetical protein IOK49_05985 [Fervidicoccus fontis]|uniref:Uncharacterized protein n=2 Tax=Fervidicoccus fontis TaxID=683846 RepID=I0A1H0_FERFK|nr:hypothetical protein [Fervidicoccus fontis]AFH42827.1 hypothetical protein FFONT_0839 [Fervidicoccus fontis Kam940]MBE9391613.1 hypothetical protein [Fervidicoccus fontis]PMB75988.1 MAG: hypothetical protein C0188_00930 [Fervidicoccus fontis]PMB77875.1 MAG: hypothetical protein C0177_02015 [Fervidicoccus fontis]HEW63563.1 hypothetical protein [Fervidicoccus fontis]